MSDERYGRERGGDYRRPDRDDDRTYGGYGSQQVYRPGRDGGDYRPRDEGGYGQRDYGHEGYRQGYSGGEQPQRYYRRADDVRPFGGRERPDERSHENHRPQNRVFEGPQPGRHEGDRGFFERASDEVRSWFGDEDAERRRHRDAGDHGNYGRDDHYHNWRTEQIKTFDRDYEEYRRENQSRFHEEFAAWRTERQGQRDLLGRVREHMEVVGSDGSHVGTVDKVSGDRIILTRSDPEAGGRHHSIPSRWLRSADERVTLAKTADEARQHWRDEEQAELAGKDAQRAGEGDRDEGPVNLNRSFPGTY